MNFNIVEFLCSAIMQGTPLLLGATGEIITEKSGNLNLGIPGIMYIGGISGVIGGFLCQYMWKVREPILHVLIPLAFCLVGSLFASLIYSFLTVTLRANQNVTGLALTTFGIGFGNFFGGSLIKILNSDAAYVSLTKIAKSFKTTLPFVKKLKEMPLFSKEKLGWFIDIFLSYGFLVYLAIIIAVVAAIVLNKTRVGLHLRAVGENPATADAAGINVAKYKYFATCIGGMIAGLGGLYFVLDYSNGIWSNNGFGDRGWLAIAIVIFAMWKPAYSIIGSYLFGGLYILFNYLTIPMQLIPLIQMLPYVVTIIVLVIVSIRNSKESQPPAALGLNYYREER